MHSKLWDSEYVGGGHQLERGPNSGRIGITTLLKSQPSMPDRSCGHASRASLATFISSLTKELKETRLVRLFANMCEAKSEQNSARGP
jgi:hypothetical protein